MQRLYLVALAALALAGAARSAPPYPRGVPPPPPPAAPPAGAAGPAVTVGEHSLSVEHISEHQTVTRPLADSGPESQAASQHRLSLLLRVGSPAVPTTAVDEFVGDFTLVTNTGATHRAVNEGTAFNTGSPTVFVSTEDLELGAQSLRSLSGKLRIFPHGEKVQVRVDPKTGTEGRHKNGLLVRVEQAEIARDRIVLNLVAEWPAALSLRGEGDEDAFTLTAELPQYAQPVPIGTSETPLPPVEGRHRARLQTTLAGLAAPIRALVVESVARSGKPVEHPFTFRDLALPLYMSDRSAAAVPAGIAAPQQVLVNGRPAGRGILEIGIAARRRAGLGPWRWERVTTDEQGRAAFRLPAAGDYRVQRRWRPTDDARRAAFARLRWDAAGLDVQAAANTPVRMPPLAATGTLAGAPPPPPAAIYETAAGPYRLRAARVQERAQGLIQYGLNDPVPRPRTTRYTTVTLTVTSADPIARAALDGIAVTEAVEADGRTVPPYSVELTRALADNPSVVTVAVIFRGIGVDWLNFRSLEGELTHYPRARLVTADFALGPDDAAMGPLGAFRDADLLLRAFRDESRDPYSYRIATEAPADASLMLLAEQGQPPVLLDARREPLRTPLRSQPRVLDVDNLPREVRASFVKPDTAPAFLRLPLVVRYGQPEKRAFQLSGIPLPLSVSAKPVRTAP